MIDEKLIQKLIERVEDRYYGKYQGFLVDNQDPQKRGRLRVLVPEVLRDVVSGWAEPCFPYGGGPDFGFFSIPPITKDDDGNFTTGIWVEFRGGNPQFPIWVGTFPGAPGGASEAPGNDAEPEVDVHVFRSASGASRVFVDTPGSEKCEWRDAAGQRLTMSSPLKDGTKRDDNGQKATETVDVSYSDLVADKATIELVDFAGNSILLDADKAAPTIRLTNKDRDGNVQQTIELFGGSASPKIVITDNNENVITMDKAGIKIDVGAHGDTIVMNAQGIQGDAPEINLNSGSKGAARLDDKVKSTIVEDSTYWTWVNTLMTWLGTHVHTTTAPGAPTSPPVVPFPGTVPSECVGKIIESSNTVIVGD
jgi:hypothetical protein